MLNIGRRAGKTMLAVIKIIDFAYKNQKANVWYVAPTYRQAKLIAWRILLDYLPPAGISKINEQELTVYLKNGTIISLKGADNPDSLRGVRIDLLIMDEVAFFNRWDEVWKVIEPTLVDSKGECWFISTPNGFNHFYEIFNEPNYTAFHFTTYDNPYVDEEEVNRIKAKTGEDEFAQEYLAEFRKMSGLIYPEFNPTVHMVDVPQLDVNNYSFGRAIDFGYAHHTALGYFAIANDGSHIYLYDGLYEHGYDYTQIAEVAKVKNAGRNYVVKAADSAQKLGIETLNSLGVDFDPVKKGKDSVVNGIKKVSELLKVRADTGKPTLMISKHLTWFQDEIMQYRWVETRSASNPIVREVPYKVNDDAMDMVRYFAMSYTRTEPEDIEMVINLSTDIEGSW